MARDYKDRGTYAQRRNQSKKPGRNALWVIAILLIAGFTAFLAFLRHQKTTEAPIVEQAAVSTNPENSKASQGSPSKKPENEAPTPHGPRFDFYTILPKAEIIIPEHEIKTRMREELNGKAHTSQYIIQAGSFREQKDADKLHNDLTTMNIASKIEKAKVGEVIWYRVKIGPSNQLSDIQTIKNRLKKSGMDAVITEVAKEKNNR